MPERTVIRGASEVVTCAQDAPDLLGRRSGASVLIEAGRIVAVDRVDPRPGDRVVDAAGGVVMPGFVDCHTHLVFAGTRVDEYAATVAGVEPGADVARGITGTMALTRARDTGQLVDEALPRLREMLEHGTTTVESKSGYGLRRDAELRQLEANGALQAAQPIDVVSTFLGAHALPPDSDRDRYVDEIVDVIPEVARRGLAEFCDAYCDAGYFTIDETRRVLAAGRACGLAPKLHLDAYSHTGAAAVAAELRATSVDHANFTTDGELEALAAAGVIVVSMPCLDFAVAHPRPRRARDLVAAGVRVALATDLCPGCYTTSMQLVVQMACRTGGLSVAQAVRAATLDAAHAVGRGDRTGSLEPGKRADVLILDVPRIEDVAYRIGHNAVSHVLKDGEVVLRRG